MELPSLTSTLQQQQQQQTQKQYSDKYIKQVHKQYNQIDLEGQPLRGTKLWQPHSLMNILNINIIILIIFIIASSTCVVRAEFFSSVDKLELLGDVEAEMIETFRQYMARQAEQLDKFRKFIDYVKLQHEKAERDPEDFLGNPINAFTLIKRMVIDWNELHELLQQDNLKNEIKDYINQLADSDYIPTENDLKGAIKGLARLQKIYNLDSIDLAEGIINGHETGTQLKWHDCYEIAITLFNSKHWELALSWFDITFQLLNEVKSDDARQKYKIDIMEFRALILFELNRVDEALSYLNLILKIDPNHIASDTRLYILANGTKLEAQPVSMESYEWFGNYSRLCQGVQIPEKIDHSLKCKINNKNNPYLILAPLKIEELSLDPEIVLYHGLLNDEQIDMIVKQVSEYMERSTVATADGGEVNDVRVSQQAWADYSTPVMAMVNRLVGEVTGFDMNNAEVMQIANYGIGGQYDPHFDYLEEFVDDHWNGDRISTSMFYFSDVEQGGYTVFPLLNVYTKPVKGSMVMWYNLHKSVAVDARTMHAGCPVLMGTKRIGNIWIHSGLQEFRRPCELIDDKYKSSLYLGLK